jgi:type IV fimbrial biogenesis protein FimT
MQKRHLINTGFTMMEMLIVLLVIAIVAALGGPALSKVVTGNKLRTEADRVLLSLSLARSEAIKSNTPVTLCRSADSANCKGDWEDGWIMFSNLDGDDNLDSSDGDTVLKVFEALPGGFTLASNTGADVITYRADGSYNGDGGVIRICDGDADTSAAWSVLLNRVGKPRMSKTTTSCP